MWWPQSRASKHYFESVGLLTLLCLVLLVYRAINTHTLRYFFVPENLILAWAGLYFGWLLAEWLKTHPWKSWSSIGLSALWLFFLPNTWYLVTDFIHVYPTGEISELYDIVLMMSVTLVGIILGYTSLYLLHHEFKKRLTPARTFLVIEAVILLSSYAIYLGRVLRWNSWDVVSNPGGLIINVSSSVLDPLGQPHAFSLAGLFFVVLSVTYWALWRGAVALKSL